MELDTVEETDIDINLDEDIQCYGIQWVEGPDAVCTNPARWRRKRHCTGPTRLYCDVCKEFLDASARAGTLECGTCSARVFYDPDRWVRI